MSIYGQSIERLVRWAARFHIKGSLDDIIVLLCLFMSSSIYTVHGKMKGLIQDHFATSLLPMQLFQLLSIFVDNIALELCSTV